VWIHHSTLVSESGGKSDTLRGEKTTSTAYIANLKNKKKKKKKTSNVPTEAKIPYRELFGCLLWISMGTRPDVSYAVAQCARYSADPTPEHCTACLRMLRYLKGTSEYGLHYHSHQTHHLGQKRVSGKAKMSVLKQPFSYESSY